MRTIIIEPYNDAWPHAFETIKKALMPALSPYILAIEHVGSTSVESLPAKPIIDIDIIIASYDVFEEVKNALAGFGYFHNGNQGIESREAFKYHETPFHVHHLYVCPQDSVELKKHLMFRDHLRINQEDAANYAHIKQEAARLHPHDIEAYLEVKGKCIAQIYKKIGL